jgi:hypothetical protein
MSLILNGTNGVSDVDGSASTPAVRGTDTNTGIFFPAADTIAFAEGGAEVARFDSSGNLLVGTTTTGSAGISLLASYNLGWGQNSGESVPNIFRQTSSAATVMANGYRNSATANGFASSLSSSYAKSAISCGTVAGGITFYTDTAAAVAAGTDVTPTERMRIDSSGNLLVGTTGAIQSTRYSFYSASGRIMGIEDASGGNGTQAVRFVSAGNNCGTISTSTTATSYNTSSDYRLKENVAPMTGALAVVGQLKPCTYKWKVNNLDGQGFIAHELAEVVPQAVTGEKDAVDDEGNPQYQGIDTSFLVATLTAAIQEQQAIITELKTRIEALEQA